MKEAREFTDVIELEKELNEAALVFRSVMRKLGASSIIVDDFDQLWRFLCQRNRSAEHHD